MDDAELRRATRDVQEMAGVAPEDRDGVWGPGTAAAVKTKLASLGAAVPKPEVDIGQAWAGTLSGDGTWGWAARIDGPDIVVDNCRMTCFGGGDDPQDSGETASGISTRKNPDLAACSLPMDGRMFSGLSKREHEALDGCPIPKVPFRTIVRVTADGKTVDLPVIDLGPAKHTGNALDLTIAAARMFDPRATARSFEARGSFRIMGGAKFAKS